ncbi:MAG TPA: outer membrane protein assembly factor BamD [Thermoanaerobaculia bacterium]
MLLRRRRHDFGGNLKLRTLWILVATLVFAVACSRGPRTPRTVVDPELLQLTKEQIWEKAEDQYSKRKWQRARSYFTHLYESFPNDPLGRRALLRIADTYFSQGDPVNLVEAQYKYRDFINRYPTSDQADYAMLQIAMSSFEQMEKPDRDQAKTREAVEKFDDMLKAYPQSKLRPQAEEKRNEAIDRLAKHEHIVAKFYQKRGSHLSAVQRLNYLVDTYPNYSDRAGVFFDLAHSLNLLGRAGEARLYFERVVSEFPQSDYAERAKRRLGEIKA